MIELAQKQINQIAKSISILDVKSYIESHLQEYEHFLKEEEKQNEENSA